MRMLCTASFTKTGVYVFGTTRSKCTRTHRGVDFLSGTDGSSIPATLHGHPEQQWSNTLRFTIDRRSPFNREIFPSFPQLVKAESKIYLKTGHSRFHVISISPRKPILPVHRAKAIALNKSRISRFKINTYAKKK